jgi:very-short-patch-repair endonuclease
MTNPPKKPSWHVRPKIRLTARALRSESTHAERVIWGAIRGHRLEGADFRRQTPIGPYVVDFVSHGTKLVIEIDGGQHFEDAHEQKDARRDAYLASKGFRVIRFSNLDVMSNREGVLATIAAAMEDAPSPPSPASGGGSERHVP